MATGSGDEDADDLEGPYSAHHTNKQTANVMSVIVPGTRTTVNTVPWQKATDSRAGRPVRGRTLGHCRYDVRKGKAFKWERKKSVNLCLLQRTGPSVSSKQRLEPTDGSRELQVPTSNKKSKTVRNTFNEGVERAAHCHLRHTGQRT